MLKIHRFAFSLAALAAFSIPAVGTAKEKTKTTKTSKMEESVAPTGFTLIEEDVSISLKDMPIALMDEAVSDFTEKNYGEATGDLKAASRYLRATEGSRHSERAAEHRKISAANLDLIAKDLRDGSIKSVDTLKERLAQVAYYEAVARRMEASVEWDHRQMKQAGYDLDGAAAALERSMLWSRKARSSDHDASVKNTRTVAEKLIAGSGWKESEVNMALSNLQSVTAAVGAKVLPQGYKASENPHEL